MNGKVEGNEPELFWVTVDPEALSSYQGPAVPGQCLTLKVSGAAYNYMSVSCDETFPAFCEYLM